MPSYYDSSFLLAALLGEPEAQRLVPFWDDEPSKVASALIEAECVTVLRRAAAQQPPEDAPRFLQSRLELMDRFLAGIALKDLDGEVLDALRKEPALSNCRTLDAIHLATALLFQEHCEVPLTLCTLDERMRRTAVELGFDVVPSEGKELEGKR